jgi:phospholipase C
MRIGSAARALAASAAALAVVGVLASGPSPAASAATSPAASAPTSPASGVATRSAAARPPTASGPVRERGNGRIAFTSGRGGDDEISVMVPDGTRQVALTANPAQDSEPAWSPNGSRIAFASDRTGGGDLYQVNADGSGLLRLTSAPARESDPAWSPDGTRIAYTSTASGDEDVWVMDADGSGPVNLTHHAGSDSQPAWTPDGTRIAYTSTASGDEDVWVMDADGSGPVNLTHHAGSDSQPAWSPDGAFLAFVSDRSGNPDVYAMTAAGAAVRDLTTDAVPQASPAFSPDGGTRIAFGTRGGGQDEIGIVNVDLAKDVVYGRVTVTHPGDGGATDPSWQPLPAPAPSGSPIRHVVVIYQENHSFDNVLGKLCVRDHRCHGTTTGMLADGTRISLPPADNHVPNAVHSYYSQLAAINGGRMNGFSALKWCDEPHHYACYQQFEPSQTPNLTALARAFVISDATFEEDTVGSWGSHLELASSNLDGFYTSVPRARGPGRGPGWGCDSYWQGDWSPTPIDPTVLQPQCIPFPDGTGPYRSSPVPWVPTIMDRMDRAGLSWRIYAPMPDQVQYGWAICPSFSDCLYTGQTRDHVKPPQVVSDATAGRLPNLSLVVPVTENSQHNLMSMVKGDNWIQKVVSAVMDGPDWDSTAIFITYDDCGCFYDHVPPPPNLGIRVPMVIVSPYARAGFTDSTVASFASMLAFTEHAFGLAPLSVDDGDAYDYSGAFDYAQRPLSPIPLRPTPLSAAERAWVRAHRAGPYDPT